jgi:hypothetical protein
MVAKALDLAPPVWFFWGMESIKQRFKKEKGAYEELRAIAHGQVVKWVLTDKVLWLPCPVCSPDEAPAKIVSRRAAANHAYGYDRKGRIVVIEDLHWDHENAAGGGAKQKTAVFEHFLRYPGSQIWVSCFRLKNLFSVQAATESSGRIVESREYRFDIGAERTRYVWDGKVLKAAISIDGAGRPTSEAVYDWANNETRFYRIRRDGTRVPEGEPTAEAVNLKVLWKTIQERLLKAIPRMVAAAGIKQRVYCLALAYDGEGDVLPPLLGIGLASEREKWVSECGKDAREMIWNPAEFAHYEKDYTQIQDEELDEACQSFNQAAAERVSGNPAKRMLSDLAGALARYDWSRKLKTTPDFVVFAVDLELADLRKNLKVSVPAARLNQLKKAGYL